MRDKTIPHEQLVGPLSHPASALLSGKTSLKGTAEAMVRLRCFSRYSNVSSIRGHHFSEQTNAGFPTIQQRKLMNTIELVDCHTHSVFSDGGSTLKENMEAALSAGITTMLAPIIGAP